MKMKMILLNNNTDEHVDINTIFANNITFQKQ